MCLQKIAVLPVSSLLAYFILNYGFVQKCSRNASEVNILYNFCFSKSKKVVFEPLLDTLDNFSSGKGALGSVRSRIRKSAYKIVGKQQITHRSSVDGEKCERLCETAFFILGAELENLKVCSKYSALVYLKWLIIEQIFLCCFICF